MPATTDLYCQVEVPKGAPLESASVPAAQPIGRSRVTCPADWCHFPDTLARGGGPLGAAVCVSEPGAPGGHISVKPIALLRTGDTRGYAEIVVCVPREDAAWAAVESARELPGELRGEIERFAAHKEPRRNDVMIGDWLSREDAMAAIDDAAARWAATVNGRG